MAVGQKRPVADNLVLMLLSLDELRQNSVQVLLKEVTPDLARWELNGKASGVVNGVSTEIELKAKFRYDRHRQCIDWFAMLVKEKREISLVEHGFDVVARVQVQVTPSGFTAFERCGRQGTGDEAVLAALQFIYVLLVMEWSILHDRRWFLTDRRRELYVLRLLDQGAEVAMCKITPGPGARGQTAHAEAFSGGRAGRGHELRRVPGNGSHDQRRALRGVPDRGPRHGLGGADPVALLPGRRSRGPAGGLRLHGGGEAFAAVRQGGCRLGGFAALHAGEDAREGEAVIPVGKGLRAVPAVTPVAASRNGTESVPYRRITISPVETH